MKNKPDRKTPRPPQEHRWIGSGSDTSRAICLHCGNAFNVGNGVVTADAAICDICNGSD
jgi:hypothetical protein